MDETLSMLKKICIKEKKKPSLKVLKQIAIDSMGCPRDALVILDSVIDLPKEKMLRAAKRSAEEKSQIIELSRALLKGGDWKKVSGILRGLNAEPETIRRNVLSYMNSVLLNGSSARAYEVADLFLDPFYDSGAAGLTCACFEATFSTTQE
jgi:DNA polymerase III gamma/tau subunit